MNPRSITGRAVGITLLCVAAMVVCSGLAWWQWDRFSSAGGTFQNLGYVLQWPLFGLFPAFMVWRWRVLSRRRAGEDTAGLGDERSGATAAAREPSAPVADSREPARWRAPKPRRADSDDRGERGDREDPADAELAAYNRYLAELNAHDQEVT
ncbi:hypothetical protein [Prauserella alba]|uniref:DNA-binding transcriptional regulator of glucitol operon n=1 Tax=Prauserella alba TaxID=176898 RepID=A0ABN1VUF2_9PSEU|nr:hypothetical protein [Prauserella alba]MCP2179884.1 hypothetical protein [Prauserella alba]